MSKRTPMGGLILDAADEVEIPAPDFDALFPEPAVDPRDALIAEMLTQLKRDADNFAGLAKSDDDAVMACVRRIDALVAKVEALNHDGH